MSMASKFAEELVCFEMYQSAEFLGMREAEPSHGEPHHLGAIGNVCGKNFRGIVSRKWPSHKVPPHSLRRALFFSSVSRPNGFDKSRTDFLERGKG